MADRPAGDSPHAQLRSWWDRVTDAHYAECATNDGEVFACDCHATVDGEAALTAAEYEQAYRMHERDEARDLAFRAAFGDEEGSEVQWRIACRSGETCMSYAPDHDEARTRAFAAGIDSSGPEPFGRTHNPWSCGPHTVECRACGPWKPVPAGPVPQEKP